MLDFQLIADSLPLYGSGVLVTFKLLFIALALGSGAGHPIGAAARFTRALA